MIGLIRKVLVKYRDRILAFLYPKVLANRTYKYIFKKDINWENPSNLIEKIYWLQLNTDTLLWTLCADKYRVREFVEERGCGKLLNELYGVWGKVDDIDFDKLPNSFVLKTNNSCGQIILVKDKSKLNIAEARKKLNNWLNSEYGYEGAQLHYTRIKPVVIAEELLLEKNKEGLIDYKIWCFNGKADFILSVSDRGWSENGSDKYSLSTYDLEWNNTSTKTLNPDNIHYSGINIDKPAKLKEMITYAERLAEGFPEVRVDFYYIEDRIIFGELTFTTGYGYFTNEFYEELGNKIDLTDYMKKSL